MSKSIAGHREVRGFRQAIDACTGLNEAILSAVVLLLLEHIVKRQQLQHLSDSTRSETNTHPVSRFFLHLRTRKVLFRSDVVSDCSEDLALEVRVE